MFIDSGLLRFKFCNNIGEGNCFILKANNRKCTVANAANLTPLSCDPERRPGQCGGFRGREQRRRRGTGELFPARAASTSRRFISRQDSRRSYYSFYFTLRGWFGPHGPTPKRSWITGAVRLERAVGPGGTGRGGGARRALSAASIARGILPDAFPPEAVKEGEGAPGGGGGGIYI